MKKKLIWMSLWSFLLGFLLMWMNFQLIYFFVLVGFFLFILWTGPKASQTYTEEEYAHDKKQTIRLITLIVSFIGAGFLALIIQTFIA